MCFGVRDALEATRAVSDPSQVTIHGELVHNPHVARELDEAGFHQSAERSRSVAVATPVVLITAHGVSQAEYRRLADANKSVIDTTCPLVRRAHEAAQELRAEGRHVLVVGKATHVEVRGIVEDLDSYDVVQTPDDVGTYESARLGIVCQTTTPPDVVSAIVARVRDLNPMADVRLIDTVCRPTKVRQQAVRDLLGQVDLVVVVGGRNSNNTRQLVELCRRHGTPVVHIEDAEELDPARFAGVHVVGLTAGTSTLDETIDDVCRALERIASRREPTGLRL